LCLLNSINYEIPDYAVERNKIKTDTDIKIKERSKEGKESSRRKRKFALNI
jgi:hypothetical protein